MSTPELFPGIDKCSFCLVEPASGWWDAIPSVVACCPDCAVEILPKLMADSLVGDRGQEPQTGDHLRRAWDRAAMFFWRAAALAIGRCAAEALREVKSRAVLRFFARDHGENGNAK
jgi:hypothetical protein